MPDTETAVVTTVGCSVLGLVLAGPVGAVLGGGLAVAALQSELRSFSKGRLHIAQVSLPQEGADGVGPGMARRRRVAEVGSRM